MLKFTRGDIHTSPSKLSYGFLVVITVCFLLSAKTTFSMVKVE